MSRQPLALTLQPPVGVPGLAAPPGNPLTFPGNPPSLDPAWPYCRSISRPSTALTRPTANSKSGRNRVRAYHSWSLLRAKVPSEKFQPIDVTWSKRPLIVTFGVGACAKTDVAKTAGANTAKTAITTNLRIPSPEASCREARPGFGLPSRRRTEDARQGQV